MLGNVLAVAAIVVLGGIACWEVFILEPRRDRERERRRG